MAFEHSSGVIVPIRTMKKDSFNTVKLFFSIFLIPSLVKYRYFRKKNIPSSRFFPPIALLLLSGWIFFENYLASDPLNEALLQFLSNSIPFYLRNCYLLGYTRDTVLYSMSLVFMAFEHSSGVIVLIQKIEEDSLNTV